MPELPEVEIVRRGLEPVMAGAVLTEVSVGRPDLRFPFPAAFARRLTGARVLDVRRRGKYLLAPLSTGEALIMHLGMSGRFTIAAQAGLRRPGDFYNAEPADPVHDHVAFTMAGPQGEARIVYNDPRRFGFMDLAPSEAIEKSRHFEGMGPEPLDPGFTAHALATAFKGKRAPVKAALLDQTIVAGLGNIYVCEALFRARISPRRMASKVGTARLAPLVEVIKAVLTEAIEAGGSTLRDFAASDGARGDFQHRFSVYDREGEPCPSCGAAIRRFVQAGRSTFACGRCQR